MKPASPLSAPPSLPPVGAVTEEQRKANLKLGLILAGMAAAIGVGFVLKVIFVGL
jgi:hypothetical protein